MEGSGCMTIGFILFSVFMTVLILLIWCTSWECRSEPIVKEEKVKLLTHKNLTLSDIKILTEPININYGTTTEIVRSIFRKIAILNNVSDIQLLVETDCDYCMKEMDHFFHVASLQNKNQVIIKKLDNINELDHIKHTIHFHMLIK